MEVKTLSTDSVPAGYKQTEVGVIPIQWDVMSLGELGSVVRGGSPRPAGDPRYFAGSYIPWLTVAAITNISDDQLRVSETAAFLTEVGAKHSRTLAEGTLIVANSGATLGVAKILGVTCCANDGIAAIINQRIGHKAFICYYINTRTRHLREVVATGNGQPNLNTTLIREISIPFPPLPEQEAIANGLSDVDALLAALDRLIAKKRDIKQAAMQQLLTAQTRLHGFSDEWEVRRLGSLGAFLKGAGVRKDEAASGELPCVRYGEIYTHHHDVVRMFNSFVSAPVDAWFDAKTKALNDWQKDELKKQWGTLQQVLSSKARMDRVIADIIFDFGVKPRLSSARGNAILVASSIYEACKYFALFQKTPFKGRCAVITSYNPMAKDVTLEETGANTETDKQFIYNTYEELLKPVVPRPGMTKTDTYEADAKARFICEPANMKLLVVVDKLLTGFDAPPCSYLYIDKSMQDHGLFQAICRTNRLDGDDKDFGHIVDYKNLFDQVNGAIAVYSSELDETAPGASPDVLLKDRLKLGRERLEAALEALALLCEPVAPPKGELEYIHYFCGNTEIATDLEEREPLRATFYKSTVALVRAFASIADELDRAGYTPADITRIKLEQQTYLNIRDIVRHAAGEVLSLKPFEADMRHLLDTYIEADEPRKISPFDDISLVDLIVKSGIAAAIASQPPGMRRNKDAVAETVENNVRSTIIRKRQDDPAYYDRMSSLLNEVIRLRKEKAIEYEDYLRRVADLAKQVAAGIADDGPEMLRKATPGVRALYNNLKVAASAAGSGDRAAERGPDYTVTGDPLLDLAIGIDRRVKEVRPADWRGVQPRELVIKQALYEMVPDSAEVQRIFQILVAQPEY